MRVSPQLCGILLGQGWVWVQSVRLFHFRGAPVSSFSKPQRVYVTGCSLVAYWLIIAYTCILLGQHRIHMRVHACVSVFQG